ncbi:MAG: pilus assembly protein TadG-related protein [Ilumatobacter sp.]|uniref:pilus assembly protein TadG-related protein n=1 Tax=Ilumatobacter sp. TaxID=1967498 RepID=UPI003C751A50
MSCRRIRNDQGSASVGLVLLVVIVIAGAGLIFDGARYLSAERHASNTAEGAARAAVATGSPSDGLQAADARQAAVDHATALGVPASDVSVSFPTRDTVVVTITERRSTTFAKFAGASQIVATAQGRARLEYS